MSSMMTAQKRTIWNNLPGNIRADLAERWGIGEYSPEAIEAHAVQHSPEYWYEEYWAWHGIIGWDLLGVARKMGLAKN